MHPRDPSSLAESLRSSLEQIDEQIGAPAANKDSLVTEMRRIVELIEH